METSKFLALLSLIFLPGSCGIHRIQMKHEFHQYYVVEKNFHSFDTVSLTYKFGKHRKNWSSQEIPIFYLHELSWFTDDLGKYYSVYNHLLDTTIREKSGVFWVNNSEKKRLLKYSGDSVYCFPIHLNYQEGHFNATIQPRLRSAVRSDTLTFDVVCGWDSGDRTFCRQFKIDPDGNVFSAFICYSGGDIIRFSKTEVEK